MARHPHLPLVYSCSGCSSAAQLANHVAVRLDREGEAEMSCIAGVGGNVPHLVKIARSGRPILALDGCALACTRSSLAQRGVTPDQHLLLNEQGVKKRYGADFDEEQASAVLEEARALARQLRPSTDEGEVGG
ncbi:MAG: putative zinc-binding protein [Thauera sp.]|jgi:uncharacterized metal-binding protein|nr:putative zinc-binding protein [Thauera sp.]